MKDRFRRPAAIPLAPLALAATLALTFVACSPDIPDNVGPRIPIPNIRGSLIRMGSPASGLDVELRELPGGTTTSSTTSDCQGGFGFGAIPIGSWEIKVKGAGSEDFESLTLPFELRSDTTVTLPAIEVASFGARLENPSDGARIPPPDPLQPLMFQWHAPDRSWSDARVQLYDALGLPVWFSSRTTDEQVAWNGVANEGSGQGALAPPGSYRWRVRFELPDSVEARTAYRDLVIE